MSKALQFYHLKQYFTSVKNDLCNNVLNCKMESSKEELSNIFIRNNFLKIRIDIRYKQHLTFNSNVDHIAIWFVRMKLWNSQEHAILWLWYQSIIFELSRCYMPNGQDLEKKICFKIIVLVICLYLSIVLFRKGIFTFKKKFTESLIPWVHPAMFVELLVRWIPINLDP